MAWASDRRTAFGSDERGGLALLMGLAMPVLAFGAAGALEVAEVSRTRQMLQSYVDAAALRGAKEFVIDQSAATVERSRLGADGAANNVRPTWTVNTTARSDVARGTVTVSQNAVRQSFFGGLLQNSALEINVTATATTLSTKSPLCVLSIQAQASKVLQLNASSSITAPGCLVQSKSDIVVGDSAVMRAGAVRAVSAASGAISPSPVTDVPVIADPFATLAIPKPGDCNDNDLKINGIVSLNPGVHCGEIKIQGSGVLQLNPGEHYFKDTEIDVLGQGRIVGSDVVLIFSGKFDATFKNNASISIEGRRSGPFAGFVLMTDRSFDKTVEISTDNARQILGTVYLPNARLRLDGTATKVADHSPWTVIIARTIRLDGSPELVLNSNYIGSAVPVPQGVTTSVLSRLIE